MVKPEIIEEAPIPMFELKTNLQQIRKKEKELNFRANKTEEYLNQFVKLSAVKSKELVDKLNGLKITRLREPILYKVVDLMPQTVEELKVILQGSPVTLNNEHMKKIIAVVKEYSG